MRLTLRKGTRLPPYGPSACAAAIRAAASVACLQQQADGIGPPRSGSIAQRLARRIQRVAAKRALEQPAGCSQVTALVHSAVQQLPAPLLPQLLGSPRQPCQVLHSFLAGRVEHGHHEQPQQLVGAQLQAAGAVARQEGPQHRGLCGRHARTALRRLAVAVRGGALGQPVQGRGAVWEQGPRVSVGAGGGDGTGGAHLQQCRGCVRLVCHDGGRQRCGARVQHLPVCWSPPWLAGPSPQRGEAVPDQLLRGSQLWGTSGEEAAAS